jgi:mRNA-degrading endonuclease HigB of HigAB toxin-antitoxin module
MRERILTRKAKDNKIRKIEITEITPDRAHMVIINNAYFKIYGDGRVVLKNQKILDKEVEMFIKGVSYVIIQDVPNSQRIYINILGKNLHYRREDGVEYLKWE